MKYAKKLKSKLTFKLFLSIQNLMRLLRKLNKEKVFLKNGKKNMILLKEILNSKLLEDGTFKNIKKSLAHLYT